MLSSQHTADVPPRSSAWLETTPGRRDLSQQHSIIPFYSGLAALSWVFLLGSPGVTREAAGIYLAAQLGWRV